MNKQNEQALLKALEGIVGNQKDFVLALGRILELIKSLIKSVVIGLFIINMLVWRVFLWPPLEYLLNKISIKWAQLTEGYQILILGFFGAIIAGTAAHILGTLLLKRITQALKKRSPSKKTVNRS